MPNKVDYDVAIVGGGMVGSMLAALLARHTSLKVAVLEQQAPEPFEPGSNPDYDIRVSALSIATQRMFENADAWQGVTSRRACAYRQMLVWDGEEQGQTHFKAEDIGVEALGHIVENRVVQLALLDCVHQSANVDYLCPANVLRYTVRNEHVSVVLSTAEHNADDNPDSDRESPASERRITTRLLVGADGARSSIRELAGITMSTEAYDHHALVASVQTEAAQQDITWQRFLPTGPQALLPLCGSQASLVWYNTAEQIKTLKGLNDEQLIQALHDEFPERLGRILSINTRGSFPIMKAHAERYISDRVALIGDAAHTVHPLAGQGVNLGMLDAAALADLIMAADEADTDIGARRLLRRYERWRRAENEVMMSVLDGFYHAFAPQPGLVRKLRSAALSLADNAGPVKHEVMRYAMGTRGHLPKLAKYTGKGEQTGRVREHST